VKMVVGLGNPGRKYERTRHNVGFEVVDELARRLSGRFRKGWLATAETAKVQTDSGQELLLVKPQTFMNLSGKAVAPLARKRGLDPSDVIVAVDDAELPAGKLRIRARGSAGGHNGLKSLIQDLGSEEFMRVRVGVGRKELGGDLAEHVLSPFSREDRRLIDEAVTRAADAVLCILHEGVDAAMNKFN
jgi:PTH1 family peptidyl-tRNA hydrolase